MTRPTWRVGFKQNPAIVVGGIRRAAFQFDDCKKRLIGAAYRCFQKQRIAKTGQHESLLGLRHCPGRH